MAQYLTIARPYAQALYENANGNNAKLSAWAEVLNILTVVVSESKIKQVIADPKTTSSYLHKTMLDLIAAVASPEVKKMHTEVSNFISLLIEHRRLFAVPDMFDLFNQLVAKQNSIMNVEVTSAFELDSEEQQLLQEALKKRFAMNIAAKYNVDRSLIGGAIIRTDKFVIDGSIKGKLQKLYHSLIT